MVVTVPAIQREEALWAEEVARILEAASTLAPAARAMIATVLASLAADTSTDDPVGRRDARALLGALEQEAAPPTGDGSRIGVARSAQVLVLRAVGHPPRPASGLSGLTA